MANPGESGEFTRVPAASGSRETTTSTTSTSFATTTQPYEQIQTWERMQSQLQQEQGNFLLSGAGEPMFSGYSLTREMPETVPTLTQAIPGRSYREWSFRPDPSGAGGSGNIQYSPSSPYSSSSSGSWTGQKRTRDQDYSVTQFPEQVQRIYGGFGESSFSVKTG